MRVVYTVMLILFVGLIGIFALQNRDLITLQVLGRSVTSPGSVLILLVYLLGMVSGWTVVGLVRRSLRHMTARPA